MFRIILWTSGTKGLGERFLFRGRRENVREPEPTQSSTQWHWQSEEGIADITQSQLQLGLLNRLSELDFEDDCRMAVAGLNNFRSTRVEILGDGYDVSDVPCSMLRYYIKHFQCSVLKNLFSRQPSRKFLSNTRMACCQCYTAITDAFVKYSRFDALAICSSACENYDVLAKSTRTEVEKSLAQRDTSNLRASFRRALSLSIHPPSLYCNPRPRVYSHLIFGVPLADLEIDDLEDNVPKVMRMCIKDLEKRALNTQGIHSVS
jgi:hypothetical protein